MAITHEEEPGLLSLRHGELPAPNKSVLQMAARDEQEKEVGVSREREKLRIKGLPFSFHRCHGGKLFLQKLLDKPLLISS